MCNAIKSRLLFGSGIPYLLWNGKYFTIRMTFAFSLFLFRLLSTFSLSYCAVITSPLRMGRRNSKNCIGKWKISAAIFDSTGWRERERPQCDNKNNVEDIRWSHREGRKCCSLNDDSPPFSPSQLHMKTLTTMTMPGEYAINFSTTKLLSLSFFHVSIRELLELGRMVEWAEFSYFCSKLSESLC